ncbi:MAG: hypothetical protein RL199_463 [Pseudomonadota bacterium]|jgi:hypothetical protein
MASPRRVLPFCVALAACATAARPTPVAPVAPVVPPPPAAPALSIAAAAVQSQGLRGPVLRLEAQAAGRVVWRILEGEGTAAERVVASAEATAADGRVSTTLPVVFGQDAAALRPYQERTTVPLLVELRDGDRRETRVVVVRSPRWPTAKVMNVQASSPEPGLLEMTLRLVLANPNPWDVRVGTLRGTAVIGGRTLDPVELTVASKVPASAEVEYELPVALTAAQAGGPKALAGLLRKGELAWSVSGAFDADGLAVPVDLAGTLKVTAR